MNVQELITALQALPSDLEVLTEGCDCDGDVASVSVERFSLLDKGADCFVRRDVAYLRRGPSGAAVWMRVR